MPRGLAALEEALAAYPVVLTQQSHVQAAIDGVASPYVRNQMRGAVQGAVERVMGHTGGVVEAGAAGQGGEGGQVQAQAENLNTQGAAAAPAPQAQQTALLNANTTLNPQAATQNPANAPAQPPGQEQAAAAAAADQHPHITENNPARVFKLQFDARRIVCCCQTPVIVGWDFCNGDPELEAVSRFFATIA